MRYQDDWPTNEHLAGDDHPVLDENRSVIAEAPHVLVAWCSGHQAQKHLDENGEHQAQRARMWRMLPPKFRILQPAVAAQQQKASARHYFQIKVPYRSMSGKCPSKGPGTPYTKQQAPSTGSSSAVLDENGEHHAHSTEHTAPSTEHRAAAAQQRRAQHRAPKQQQQHEHQAHSSNWGAYTITTNYKKNIFSQAHRRQHPTTSTPSAPTHGLSSGATAS